MCIGLIIKAVCVVRSKEGSLFDQLSTSPTSNACSDVLILEAFPGYLNIRHTCVVGRGV